MTALAEQARIALGALRANWFRAVLTALGIIIGVASLIAVAAVSAGAQREVAASIRRLGSNVILVDGELITIGTRTTSSDRTLTPADAQAIALLPTVTRVTRYQDIEGLAISSGPEAAVTRLFGVTTAYADIYNQSASRGRLLDQADVTAGRGVIVLGLVPRQHLFPGRDPIGRTVRVGTQELTVVGVQAHKGKLGGESLDDRVFVPLPVVTRVLLGGQNTKSIGVRVRMEADIAPTQDRIETLLRRRHRLPESFADDFSTEDQAELVKEAARATGVFRTLTFALGGIALLVGGIGIMNMMLVSVHERTREIGIRKCVGASAGTIQGQFLIEAGVLSALGGLAGVVVGFLATRPIAALAGWQVALSPRPALLAFAVALATGLVFAVVPARRAARLDPILALRRE